MAKLNTFSNAIEGAKLNKLIDHRLRRSSGNFMMKFPHITYTMNGVKVLITENGQITPVAE